ncbi:MAG: endonuclease/exonuclease/phosphatase family protein [Halieaceae bacterium]
MTTRFTGFSLTASLAFACLQAPAAAESDLLSVAPACVPGAGISVAPRQAGPQLRHDHIRLANWNIKKSSEIGWDQDLSVLTQEADLILLQEATLERPVAVNGLEAHFGIFAAGYRTDTLTSGVMTLSRVPAAGKCALSHREPWLRTPKATAITHFPVDNGNNLLVINLHGVNFTFTARPLQQQLADIGTHIEQHQGPLILAGDFNTWSDARQAELGSLMSNYGLDSVTFTDDQRITVLDNPLDHILTRGLTVISSHTLATGSSDHNGLVVTLSATVQPDPGQNQALAATGSE